MFVRLFTGVVFITTIQSAFAATAPVGATPGSFSVDPNGGASYSIPIAIPPGTGGMVPSIALSYSKSVDNQLVGVGFSISGLSIIHRCGRTIALDGQKGGVNYDVNDRFCIDGQRLVAINGEYGANGTEYRTERESFGRFFSYRDSSFTGSGPQYFSVTTKDGTVMEYGVTEDSRIEAQGKATVRLWTLNKVRDVKGNYYVVSYGENNTNGEYRPLRIDYTGNANTGLLPYNSVRFNYAARPDSVSHYEAGSLKKVTQRLTSIQSYANDTSCASTTSCPANPAPSSAAQVVRTYNVSYDNNGAEAGTLSTPIIKPGFEGWTWMTGGRRVDDNGMNFLADVNGDGKKDHVFVAPANGGNPNRVHVGLSVNGTFEGWTSISESQLDPGSQVLLGDVNGDGREDLVFITGPSGNYPGRVHVGLSAGSSFTFWAWHTAGRLVDDGSQSFLADVNGDGRADLVNITGAGGGVPGRVHIGLSTGTSFEAWTWNTAGRLVDDGSQSFLADVNGDGRADLVNITGASGGVPGRVHIGLSLGSSFQAWTWNTDGRLVDDGSQSLVADVNGDGRADLVNITGAVGTVPGRVHIGLSSGNSFQGWTWNTQGRLVDDGSQSFLADVNGDGRADLVNVTGSAGTQPGRVHVGFSSDNAFAGWTWMTEGRLVDDGSYSFVGDTDGDGKADFINVTGPVGSQPGRVHIGISKDVVAGQSVTSVGRSRLIGVTECASDGVCLEPTTITWTNKSAPALQTATGGQLSSAGFGDIYAYTKLTADVNGDGIADIVIMHTSDSGFHAYTALGRGDGTFFPATGGQLSSAGFGEISAYSKSVGDLNGDGRADLVIMHTSDAGFHAYTALGRGDGTFHTASGGQLSSAGLGEINAYSKSVGDFNGDGITDLVIMHTSDSGFHAYTALGRGDGTFMSATGGLLLAAGFGDIYAYTKLTADVNSDGITDLVIMHTSNSGFHAYTALGRGDGTFHTASGGQLSSAGLGEINAYSKSVGDFNGDGITDLVIMHTSDSGFHAYTALGRGDGTFMPATGGQVLAAGLGELDAYSKFADDINGDGISDFVIVHTSDAGLHAYSSRNAAVPNSSQLSSVRTGLGVVTNVAYKPLTDSSVYTKDADAVYPYHDVKIASYVVSSVSYSDDLGGQYGVTYQYGGAKAHLTGPGWLGFRWTKSADERTGISTVNYFNQIYDGTSGTTNSTQTIASNGVVVNRQDSFWSSVDFSNGRKFARQDGTLVQNFELNGNQVSCASVDNTYRSFDVAGDYGDFGNPSQTIAKTDTTCSFASAFVKTSASTYKHDKTNWILGRVAHTTILHEAPGESAVTRTSSFSYNALGMMTEETVEPDSLTLWLKTAYAYDVYANRTGIAVTGPDIEVRNTTNTYDSRGQFAVSITNALGQGPINPASFDPRWGSMLTQTDANGRVVSFAYDGFGRKISETHPDGTTVSVTYAVCDESCPALAKYKVTVQPSGGAPATSYYDNLERVIRTEGVGFNGVAVYQDTEYDSLGRVKRKTHPYFAGATRVWEGEGTAYDSLGRVTSASTADGQITTTVYDGLTTSVVVSGPEILTRSRTSRKNAAGRVVSIEDSKYPNQLTIYRHDAVGQLIRVTDPLGNQTTMDYDLRGRKIQMSDPDLGTWTYGYNSIGELISQCDSRCQTQGQPQTVTYDKLGRIRTRVTVEGTSQWSYDTAAHGVGSLASVSGPNGYQQTHTYDDLGHITATTTVIDGESYSVTTSYYRSGDSDTVASNLGRVRGVTYPVTGFATKNIYSNRGHLTEIRNNQNNALYWQVSDTDAQGRALQESYGNGLSASRVYDSLKGTLGAIRTTGASGIIQDLEYHFDVLGNLLSRSDHLQNRTESFQYDELDRLTSVTGSVNKMLTYDVLGNIVSKSDVGTYTYGQAGSRPHAVTATSGILNATYAYDANGNLISGAGRSISYTSFNKPQSITKDGGTSTFIYDADFRRIKKVTPNSTTVYLGAYQRVTANGLVEHKHYISTGNAMIVYTQRNNAQNDTRYFHVDHLGSIETITDESGAVLQKLSFDAYGKRRNSDWTDTMGTPSALTVRGYTGHEMDDEAGLINMNAREYDPVLGRFLQADAMVEDVAGQGLNRYSYVLNNPLSYTDPSGHLSLKRVVNKGIYLFMNFNMMGVVNKPVVDLIQTNRYAYAIGQAFAAFYGGPAGAAAYTAYFNYQMTGSLNKAARAGAIAYASAYAGNYVRGMDMAWYTQAAAQGIVAGSVAELSGGSFEKAFKYAFAASVLRSALDASTGDSTYSSSPAGATTDAVYKPDPNLLSDPDYFNKAMEVCPNIDVCSWSAANVGSGVYAKTADEIGKPVLAGVGGPGSESGSVLQFAAKHVPGTQALGNLHDMHMGVLQRMMNNSVIFQVVNVATIPVYAYGVVQSFGYQGAMYQYELERRQ